MLTLAVLVLALARARAFDPLALTGSSVYDPELALDALSGGKICKCVDKYKRCTDNWCNINCNHIGAKFCPPAYCRCAPTPTPPPPPTPFDPNHPSLMCVKVPNGTHYDKDHKILNGVCCAASCGTCGGPECGSRDGGRENCCVTVISPVNKNCDKNLPPCVFAIGELPPNEGLALVAPEPKVQAANEKVAAETTANLGAVMARLHAEMKGFEAVPMADWTSAKYYNKETPVSAAQVCMVERAVNLCLEEQVGLALENLKSAKEFEKLLSAAGFKTGFPKGKAQDDNVAHLMQAVSNTGHGLVVNLIGWLHKSYHAGKGQYYACSTRALGFGDYAHQFYKGAFNTATGMTGQLARANYVMAALLNKTYTPPTCLAEISQKCA